MGRSLGKHKTSTFFGKQFIHGAEFNDILKNVDPKYTEREARVLAEIQKAKKLKKRV